MANKIEHISGFYNSLNSNNIESAVHELSTLLQDVTTAKLPKQQKSTVKSQPWWDNELEEAKGAKYKCLRYWKKVNTEVSRVKYRAERNRFKALCKLKRMNYQKVLKAKLELCKNSSQFWKYI